MSKLQLRNDNDLTLFQDFSAVHMDFIYIFQIYEILYIFSPYMSTSYYLACAEDNN